MADIETPVEQAAVPPTMVEKVTPPTGGSSTPVANVTVDYPPRFQQMVRDVATANNPESRVRLADAVVEQNKETEVYRPNQKPQWDKVLVNILSRNYNEALKWYNGGGVKEVEGRDINNNIYYKEENELGFTGRYKDRDGKLLTRAQIDALNKSGGVFTNDDEKALKTLPWVNGKFNAELANKGLTAPVPVAMNSAYNAARVAGASNHNIDEQLQLANGMRGVLDHISKLPPERRQKLLGYVSRLNQIGTSQNAQSEKRLNVNTGASETAGKSANLSLGGAGGGGGEGVAPPTTGKVGVGLGASTSGTNQTGASGGASNTAGTSSNTTLQEQQTLQAAIQQELQGVIKDPMQFQQFMRLQALNASNYAAYNSIPVDALPPTWNLIPENDLYSGGADRMIANLVAQQRNNAVLAGWSKNLYQATREMAKSGKTVDLDAVSNEFQNSELFKAINNTYRYKMDSHLKGQLVRPPKGTKMVNGRNEIITYEE